MLCVVLILGMVYAGVQLPMKIKIKRAGKPGIDWPEVFNRRYAKAMNQHRGGWNAKAHWYAEDTVRRHRNNYPEAYNS